MCGVDANHYADIYNATGAPPKKITILDSTLREGELHPGVSFTTEQKQKLAAMLDEFGVAQIDIPVLTSQERLDAARKIMRQGLEAEIVVESRINRADIDAALSCDAKWVATYIGVSNIHLTENLNITEEEAVAKVTDFVDYVKSHGLRVRLGLEDSSRADHKFLLRVAEAAEETKVDSLALVDTVGIMLPRGMHNLVSSVRKRVRMALEVHTHNDMGLALANALAACDAGAGQIHTAVNGIGERIGIPALAETAVALTYLYRSPNNFRLDMLQGISRHVQEYTGTAPYDSMPIVGECAYKHKAGTHLAAILRNPKAYEPVPPQAVGNQRRVIFGELAGKAGASYLMAVLGITDNSSPEDVAASLKKLGIGDLVDIPLDERLQRIAGMDHRYAVAGKNRP